MSNFFSNSIDPVRTFNAYHMLNDIDSDLEDSIDFDDDDAINIEEDPTPDVTETTTEDTSAASGSSGSYGSSQTSSGASGSGSAATGNGNSELYDNYKEQMNSIYGSSLNSSPSILTAIKGDINLVKTAYCNYNISNFEETKTALDEVIEHFYTNFTRLNSEDSLNCLNKMLAALNYNKEHTDDWLKAHLVRNESGDSISDKEITIKREQYDEYFSGLISTFTIALSKISQAQAKDLTTITSANDIANLPNDYSATIELLKKELGENAESILNYSNCTDSDSIAKNNKKIQAAISNVLNDNYSKFFDGSIETDEQMDELVKQIRELNYLSYLYTVPTNLSSEQISEIQKSMETFTSNPTDANYYNSGLAKSQIDKDNIDFQDEIPAKLKESFEKLSKTIGAGNHHVASDTTFESGGEIKDPSTPGSEAREELRKEILSIRDRGEFESVELATILQRELKAINTAQNLELKKYEEEFYNIGDEANDIQSMKSLQKELKDKEDEYKAAIEGYSNNLYTNPTITGTWSGEAVSGSLSGTTENTIDYDKLKTKYEIEINQIKEKIEKAKAQYEYEIKRMKSVFDQEVADLVETLSKLGVVATLTYNM